MMDELQRNNITIVFCLHEVELQLKDNFFIKRDLEDFEYYYPDFLRDFFLYFLDKYCYVCYESIYDEFINQYSSFICHYPDSSGILKSLESYLYKLYHKVLPVFFGQCSFTYQYYNRCNSLFYLHVP